MSRPTTLSPTNRASMAERQELEALFLAHRVSIERIAASVCRRYALTGDDADDFASWTTVKLLEDDYAVLRKFRGESKLTTYLTVVIVQLFRDYNVRQRGRWRPSAAARRLGAVAVKLEALVYRDGYRLDQAGELLRTGGVTALSDAELGRLLAQLPPHALPRPVEVGTEPLELAVSAYRADAPLVEEDTQAQRRALVDALHAALDRLDPEDRLLVCLRIWEEMKVADIARALELEQKPLYRRLEKIFARLRESLEAAGFTREETGDLLEDWTP